MKVGEVLRTAKDRIATPSRWSKGRDARDASGNECDLSAAEATCWCSLASVHYVCAKNSVAWDRYGVCVKLLDRAAKDMGHQNSIRLNDATGTHADVMKMFDLAIEMAERRA